MQLEDHRYQATLESPGEVWRKALVGDLAFQAAAHMLANSGGGGVALAVRQKGGLRSGELQDGAVRFTGRCARLRTENHLLHVRVACWWKERWTGVKRTCEVGRSAEVSVVSLRMLSQERRRSMPWGRRIGSHHRSAPSTRRSTGRFYLGRVRPELELESDRGDRHELKAGLSASLAARDEL